MRRCLSAPLVRWRRDRQPPQDRAVCVREPWSGRGLAYCWFTEPDPLPGVHGLRCCLCGRRARGRARHWPECPGTAELYDERELVARMKATRAAMAAAKARRRHA